MSQTSAEHHLNGQRVIAWRNTEQQLNEEVDYITESVLLPSRALPSMSLIPSAPLTNLH